MIDVFNCLVKSQKIPIFSIAGEPYNALLMRIANQTDADVVIIGGMGLRFDDYQAFIDNAEKAGSLEKTVMFIHLATDPAVECLLVPDMALACAEKFAVEDKNVLVLAHRYDSVCRCDQRDCDHHGPNSFQPRLSRLSLFRSRCSL